MPQSHPRFHRTVELIPERRLDPAIEAYVERGDRVMDLGCGSGELLEYLIERKEIQARGVEISSDGIKACIAKGLSVYQGDLDDGFKDFDPDVFDVVILNLTLSMLHNPDLVLPEIVRLGKRAIVSFYNFGYYPARQAFYESGEIAALSPENVAWYKFSQIHPFSINELEALCTKLDIEITAKTHVDANFQPLSGDHASDPQKWAFAAVYVVNKTT